MGFKGICMTFLLVLLVFILTNSKAKGEKSISKEEDMELERQLKILNKPPIKTIQTEWGDIIDCIDTYKQPAFDHPLLKNHKIQMRPSSLPKGLERSTNESKMSKIMLKSVECPKGTVPIKRTQKKDLIRAKSFLKEANSTNYNDKQIYQAVYVKLYNQYQIFYGARADISVYHPYVYEDEYSTAQIWVLDGTVDTVIEAGWTVSPPLYNDYQTRLFTAWTRDGYKKTGCFNTICPGFVQVDRSLYPSSPITNTSTYDGNQYTIPVIIYMDRQTDHWWLMVSGTRIGYWPNSILGLLGGEGADSVYWGGVTKAGQGRISPPLGSSTIPDGNYKHSSFFKRIQFINELKMLEDPKDMKMEIHVDCPFYNITNEGYKDDTWGNMLFFGGPGGPTSRCSKPSFFR